MSCAISGITPAKGTRYGGQTVTITGTGFGASGTVTVDGRAAKQTSWTATRIVFKAPARRTNGNLIYTGGNVAVQVTAQDASQAATTYEYSKTQIEKAADSFVARLGAMSVDAGYNHDTTPDSIRRRKQDGTIDSGNGWPQFIVFIESGTTITHEPFDSNKDTASIIVQGAKPCEEFGDWESDAMAVLSDIRRAIMRDISNGGVSNSTTTTDWNIGQSTDTASGSLSAASMTFSVEVQSIVNDMTTNTDYNGLLT
jgi:hypothetical protein